MQNEEKSFGYPSRENVDNLLDAFMDLKNEYKTMLTRLEYVLLSMETEEGVYTFPDGESFPAGIKVPEPV